MTDFATHDGDEDYGYDYEEDDGAAEGEGAEIIPFPSGTNPARISAERDVLRARLADFDVAPENVRYGEPADDEIPQLAETIAAAGVLQPLQVRKGRKGEARLMVLDGRRRLLALQLLGQQGRLPESYAIDHFLVAGKDQQAAAAVLTNTELAPIHVADFIIAVGKLLKKKMTVAAIAKALGYSELDVRRNAALSKLHPAALEALKKGVLNIGQARLLARIPDTAKQGQMATLALNGDNYWLYNLRNMIDSGRMTANNRLFKLVGVDAYVAAGGKIEEDLFGELPATIQNPELVVELWRNRAESVNLHLADLGMTALFSGEASHTAPDGFAQLPYVNTYYFGDELKAQLAEARDRTGQAREALAVADMTKPEADTLLAACIRGQLDEERVKHPSADIRAVVLHPDPNCGLGATFFAAPVAVSDEDESDEERSVTVAGGGYTPPAPRGFESKIEVPQGDVEVNGVSHALHTTRTTTATRGLIRALADDPGAALAALIARLFVTIVLRPFGASVNEAALAITVAHFPAKDAIDTLDGEVRSRLAARQAQYLESGLRPIVWVDNLPHGEKMALLAELTALTLDLRELRTDSLRRGARADASDIAELCNADIAEHWTPDAAYLGAHNTKQLVGMLETMGGDVALAKGIKKDEVVDLVENTAAEKRWAPDVLDFRITRGRDRGRRGGYSRRWR